MVAASTLEHSVRRAIAWLAAAQLPDGEFPSERRIGFRDTAHGREEELVDDSTAFSTALVLYSLGFARSLDPAVDGMIRRGCGFLRGEMEPGGLWRYWSSKHPRHTDIPLDLDTTSSSALALTLYGVPFPDNRGVIHDSRDAEGRFRIWLGRANSARKWLLWLRTHGRAFRSNPETLRPERYADTCIAVNANILLYLGETPQTEKAARYLDAVIRAGAEDSNNISYAHRVTLYYFLSRLLFNGQRRFEGIRATLLERTLGCRAADGSFGDEMQSGLGICALLNLDPGVPGLEGAVAELLRTQRADGSWRRVPMHGYRDDPDFCGSAALVTGHAIEALARYAAARAGTPLSPPTPQRIG